MGYLVEQRPERYKRHLFAEIADKVAYTVGDLYFSGYKDAAAAIGHGRSIAQRDLDIAVSLKGFNQGDPVILNKEVDLEIELWHGEGVSVELGWRTANAAQVGYSAEYRLVESPRSEAQSANQAPNQSAGTV